jgi:septal ring factor EnvC (AmiA/AmiB activator)
VSGALAVAIGFGRTASQDLTHVGLTLAPLRRRSRWLAAAALVAGALAAGLAVGYAIRDRAPQVVQAPAGPSPELRQLRQQFEQAQMAARLSDARSHELERQIDELNQKLTASQDELTFFRKAREGKHERPVTAAGH